MSKINYKQTLSKKYASSLFDYLKVNSGESAFLDTSPVTFVFSDTSNQNIGSISENIRFLQYLLLTNDELNFLFDDASYSSIKKLELVKEIVPNLSVVFLAFLKVLAERNQLSFLKMILDEYTALYNNYVGIKHIKIISRVPVSRANQYLIKRAFSKSTFNSTNKRKLIFDFIISDNIFAGLVIIDGFSRIDLSLKNKMRQVLQTL